MDLSPRYTRDPGFRVRALGSKTVLVPILRPLPRDVMMYLLKSR